MTSLYAGTTTGGDGIASPLLGKPWGSSADNFNENDGAEEEHASYRDKPTPNTSTSTPTNGAEAELELTSHGGTTARYMGDDDEASSSCCPQWLKSVVALLIAGGGIALSVLCFVYTPVDPLQESIWVYIMAGFCLLNSFIMLKNERTFMFTLPSEYEICIPHCIAIRNIDTSNPMPLSSICLASRRAVVELLEGRRILRAEFNSMTKEISILEKEATR